jgi:uncharacterized Zn-finger protein
LAFIFAVIELPLGDPVVDESPGEVITIVIRPKSNDDLSEQIEEHSMFEHSGGVKKSICDKKIIKKVHAQENIKLENCRYVCKICLKDFAERRHCYAHLDCHEGITVCTICDKSFSTVGSLTTHMSTHSNKYCCRNCGKSFSSTTLLKNHYGMHKGEHKCHVCSKVFSANFNLKKHLRIVHFINYVDGKIKQ